MHPPPGRPEAERRPCHQQRSREKDPGSESPVEPAAEEQTKQRRDDDRPAENADLAEPRAERGFGIGTTLRVALRGSFRSPRKRSTSVPLKTQPPVRSVQPPPRWGADIATADAPPEHAGGLARHAPYGRLPVAARARYALLLRDPRASRRQRLRGKR